MVKNHRFAHSQTMNKLGKIVKNRPLSEPIMIAGFGGFRPLDDDIRMEYNSNSQTSRKITGDWLNRSED